MMKPGWAAAMMDSMALVAQSLHKIALPALVIHAARDPIVNYTSSEFVYSRISSEDKTFLRFEGLHEVLHDVEQERARCSIRDWILERTS
jgi:esterase/lipase